MEIEYIAPKARTADLVVKDLADEVLVYDLKRHNAHCLNRAAALVWQHCDGRRSVSDLADVVGRELAVPVSEEMIWYSLEQLSKFHLLAEKAKSPLSMSGMSRRDFMRKAGVTAAVSIPIVASLAVPTAAHAALSCIGRVCNGLTNPCSGGCTCNNPLGDGFCQ
jgi:hypothetical protein